MKWRFTLPNSEALRQAIEDEEGHIVLHEIINGYQWMATRFNEDMSYEIETIEGDIECAAFDESSVDYHLNNFYDDCDARKVWIAL